MRRRFIPSLLALLAGLVILAGCGASAPATVKTTAASPNTDAIVAQVVATVEPRLAATVAAAQPQITTVSQPLAAASANADLQQELIDVYQQANPAVVYIIIPSVGSGSGFVYSADGYIVTNNHVVASGRSYEVVFASGDREQARLVGRDPDSDLAVLKVDKLPAGVQPLPLATVGDIQVGQFVIAIGNPFGEQGSMSLGIVSGLDRSLLSQRAFSVNSTYSIPQVIQTDAPINPGNSGGPLLNLAGEVVGVNSAIATTTGTNSGVGFSIPVAAVHRIVPSLIKDGAYAYPYMGISFDDEITLSDEQTYGLSQTQGAYVISITAGSPAAQAGLVAANPNTGRGGDLVVALDGQTGQGFLGPEQLPGIQYNGRADYRRHRTTQW